MSTRPTFPSRTIIVDVDRYFRCTMALQATANAILAKTGVPLNEICTVAWTERDIWIERIPRDTRGQAVLSQGDTLTTTWECYPR